MALCGSTATRSGHPCKRRAGWGTSHRGEGLCRTHDTAPAEPVYVPGSIREAREYRIDDGLRYALPLNIPYAVTALGGENVQRYMREWTQQSSYRFGFDAPYRTQFDGPVWLPSEDPLMEWDHQTRQAVLTECHAAYHRNPIAKAAIRLTRYFSVGKGHEVTCRNAAVQDVIDRFRANVENCVRDYEKAFLEDLLIDGELFIRLVRGGVDKSVIVPIPPWYITEIETEPGFLRRVFRYHMQYTQTVYRDGAPMPMVVDEWIPAAEVLHVAINRHSYELRGRSDLFTVLAWLGAYKDWLENRARQNKYRNTLVWDVAIDATGAPTAVDKAKSTYATPPTDGSIVVHDAREAWSALTNPVGAGDAAEDGRQIKLMAAAGLQLPEYMLSDGENANLASATAQQMPALNKFQDAQDIMTEQVWTPIYKWVVQQAVDTRELPDMVQVEDSDGDVIVDAAGQSETVQAVDAFDVAFPELQEDDPKTMAEAMQIAVMNGWVSNQTASVQLGFDWSQEQKRIAREKEQARDEIEQGLRAPQPGMTPPDEDDEGEGDDGTDSNNGMA